MYRFSIGRCKSIMNYRQYANSSPRTLHVPPWPLLWIALHYEIAYNKVARRCTAITANSLSERCPARSRLFVDPFGESPLSRRAGLNADTRLLKIALLPAHRSPHPYYSRRPPDLFEFHSDFNYLAFPARDRKDTRSRSQLIRANVSLQLSHRDLFPAVSPHLHFRRFNWSRPPRSTLIATYFCEH